MSLTLAMLRCPDSVAPETRTVSGGEYWIGRGPENDWVLTDPERGLSKRHCAFAFRAGGWQVADMSTNGTYLNREAEPIGRGQARDLRSGDRLSFGAYEIEIRIDADVFSGRTPAAAPVAAANYAQQAPSGVDPFAARRSAAPELFALDPFASHSDRDDPGAPSDPLLGGGGGDPFASGIGQGGITLPADFDPLAPDRNEREFRGPVQSDHSPHIEDAFAPPAPRSVLPDDWDREFAGAAAPQTQMPAPEPMPAPPLPAPPLSAPTRAQPIAPSLTETTVPPTPWPSAAEPTTAGRAPISVSAPVAPIAEPAPRPQPKPADDLFAAFLRGVGRPDLQPADPAAALEALGAAFRAFVSGLRKAMIARAAVKGEFRIEQTMIRSRGNNPLKFSADDDDALAALLGVGRRSDMRAQDAIDDALRDIRQHELATVSAMQAAVRALLAEFEPAKIEKSAAHGSLTLLATQRKASAWDAFQALHTRITQALLDDFDSVFGKAFARAYEQAIGDIGAQEPPAS